MSNAIAEILTDFLVFTDKYARYPKEKELEYLVIGLVNESLEFYLEYSKNVTRNVEEINKLLSEISDIFWYSLRLVDKLGKFEMFILYMQVLGVLFTYQGDIKDINGIILSANNLLSYYKKSIRKDYSLDNNKVLTLVLELIIPCILVICKELNTKSVSRIIYKIYETNVNKLDKRNNDSNSDNN